MLAECLVALKVQGFKTKRATRDKEISFVSKNGKGLEASIIPSVKRIIALKNLNFIIY